MKKNTEYTLLIIILAAAVFTRFYCLGDASLFNDELATVQIANSETITEMMTDHILKDVHPPGFQLMMFFVVHNFGDSEFWLRLPTAISGIFAVFMIYVLGRHLFTSKEGLIAAAMTLVFWAPLYYSQEARAYSFLFLFAMVLMFYWMKIVESYRNNKNPKIHWKILFMFFGIFSAYFQYLGLFFLILLGLATIFIFAKDVKVMFKALIPFIIIAIAFLPWLPYALDQIAVGPDWIKRPKILAFGYYLAFLFNLSPYVLGIALILFLLLFIQLWKSKFPKENLFMNKELLLILWLLVPFTIIFIKSMVSKPVLTYYSLIISAPAAYLLFARGITTLKLKEKTKSILAVMIFLFVGWQLVFDMDYYSQPYKDHFIVFGKRFNKRTKEMFKEAAIYVKEHDSKYHNSIIAAHVWFPYYFNYYFDKIDYSRTVNIHLLDAKDTTKFIKNPIFNNKDYIWILRGHKAIDTVMYDWISRHFIQIHHEAMVGADVWLYKIDR